MSQKRKKITSNTLFIVESPSKIKTLNKIFNSLGKQYIFKATFGHIKDLPRNNLGLNLQNFEPKLEILPKKWSLLKELKEMAPHIEEIYLATDPDREGEAISYHLYEFFKTLPLKIPIKRLELHEITEQGVKRAFQSVRTLDENLYLSWKARRVFDRLIGYTLSPYVSRHFQRALSVGRVQSPALRLIVEREREIENFVPEKSYSLWVQAKDEKDNNFILELYYKKELFKSKEKEELLVFFDKHLQEKVLNLWDSKEKVVAQYPPMPFRTTTLIEASGKALGLSPKETMKLAQDLYEEGYITYMRTDSVRASPLAKEAARTLIRDLYGEEYVGKERRLKKVVHAQEAHECIRPTYLDREPHRLSPKHLALYRLIWQTFLASQMSKAEYLEKNLIFRSETLPKGFYLLLKGKKLLFDGFLRLYGETKEEKMLPEPHPNTLTIISYEIKEHESKPPERYTPQSLILKMEKLGIGRPSTYSTILDTLFSRGYVFQEGKYLRPTSLGKEVSSFLEEKVSPFVDYQFTAHMERELDNLIENKRDYFSLVKELFDNLQRCLSK